MAVRVRDMTADEVETIRRLAHARTEAARTVERAQIIWQARAGKKVPAIAQNLGLTQGTVRLWLKRFNAEGVDGLADRPRAGRPATYTPEQVGEVLAAALTPPQQVGLPFGSWTLDRLEVYLGEQKGIPIKRTRIDDLLLDESLRWRQQETWFSDRAVLERALEAEAAPEEGGAAPEEERAAPEEGERGVDPEEGERRVDPAFAQMRGPSSASPLTLQPAASS